MFLRHIVEVCRICSLIISQFDIPAPRALRLPNKGVNWLRLGLESRFSALHPRAGRGSLLTALFGSRDLRNRGYRTRALECRTSLFYMGFGHFSTDPSDSFEILHTCRNCLETNIRQICQNLCQASSEIWACEK